ncbi:MAG TPA: translation initiation factor IF-5A [Thermoproteota archaeon]|nr:translation initiation factor IF-5A [Thermoproteota archaeon]
MSKITDLGGIKEGSWLMIDGEPCQAVEVTHSKPGKHGSAKARIVGIGLFDGSKHTILNPVSANVEVPLIEKKTAQVLSVTGNMVQLMDMQSYESMEFPLPSGEIAPQIKPGVTVEYWYAMGKYKIMRVKSE